MLSVQDIDLAVPVNLNHFNSGDIILISGNKYYVPGIVEIYSA